MNRPLISIIIPVFNVENYVKECINSVINQTYRNLEILLINDGSNDRSGLICDEFADIDTRIKVFHNVNQGVSASRNFGMENCHGQFVVFVDSDDWLDKDFCEILLSKHYEFNVSLVICNYVKEYYGHQSIKKIYDEEYKLFDSYSFKRRILGPYKTEMKYLDSMDSLSPVWGKLYKIEDVKNIGFLDLNKVIGEDTIFNFYVADNIKNALFLNKPLYHYRKDNASSFTNNYIDNLFSKYLDTFEIYNEFISNTNENKKELIEVLNNRICFSIVNLGINIIKNNKYKFAGKLKEIEKIMKNDFYKKAVKDMSLRYLPIHWKVFFFTAKIRSSILLYILMILMEKKVKKRK